MTKGESENGPNTDTDLFTGQKKSPQILWTRHWQNLIRPFFSCNMILTWHKHTPTHSCARNSTGKLRLSDPNRSGFVRICRGRLSIATHCWLLLGTLSCGPRLAVITNNKVVLWNCSSYSGLAKLYSCKVFFNTLITNGVNAVAGKFWPANGAGSKLRKTLSFGDQTRRLAILMQAREAVGPGNSQI